MAGIETPLGLLRLTTNLDDLSISGVPHAALSSSDVTLAAWTYSSAIAELLYYRPSLSGRSGPPVSDCIAALWRIQALTPHSQCVFEGRLESPHTIPSATPDTGQMLAAVAWNLPDLEVLLGAPDAEGLHQYKNTPLGLPAAWRTLIDVDDSSMVFIEDFLSDGLRLRLPGLAPGEVAQAHFVVAWAPENDDAAAWLAVDQSPQELFRDLAHAF
jgi:hypothetical protein